ncbi:YqaJ viral recombinase family protein [Variovorax sp. YR566]|uniref:YqaJ viral recombinase family nuclease n=1 Tax=Variovorax sp. YR566 TaxID=3450237 RepID=UPI003F7F1224
MVNTRAGRLRTPRSTVRPVLQLVEPPPTWELGCDHGPGLHEAGLGNLDAAAALGQDPFKSQVRLWMEKTGRRDLLHPVRLDHDSSAYWSRLLEPIVAAHYTLRTGRRVRRINATLQHPEHPWMSATVVREVVASSEVQLLECLSVGMQMAPLWALGVPEYIRLRVLHQLAVTGAQAADVVVLLGGQELQVYRIERHEFEIARLIRQERAFWRHVERDQAPPASDGDG